MMHLTTSNCAFSGVGGGLSGAGVVMWVVLVVLVVVKVWVAMVVVSVVLVLWCEWYI